MRRNVFALMIVLVCLAACRPVESVSQAASFTEVTSTTVLPSATNTLFPTDTPVPTVTSTPTVTPTPTLVPTPTWQVTGPGVVTAPILLYHHISPDGGLGRYDVTPENFEAQMQALEDWGYTSITATQLIQAITEGAPLPPRPVVITFDDGNLSVYEYAFPIMQKHGFIGVTYLVANRFNAEGFTNVEQVLEMVGAGWEVGSHSYTHANLTEDHSRARDEILESKRVIGETLGVDVNTFAYPFGAFDQYVGKKTFQYGYLGAMGLGKGWEHSDATLFYLQRREIQYDFDLEMFASVLPWSEPLP